MTKKKLSGILSFEGKCEFLVPSKRSVVQGGLYIYKSTEEPKSAVHKYKNLYGV